ncbi:MAG TPA: glycosyltransferase family 1 protein [Gammaproteobacteria bacterium]|nr:glycosyltransferase family 1 protein [Gammaproteobacteria bacterium]
MLSLHWGYSIGGVGKYGVLVDKAARRAGIAVEHVCIRGRNWQVDGKTLAELNAREIVLNSRMDLSWLRTLCRYLRTAKPDLIMTHGFNGHFVARLLRKSGCFQGGIISSYHGLYHATTAGRKWLAPLFNGFTEWHVGRTLGTVAVAAYSKQYLVEKGIPGERVEVIHNGIEDSRVDPEARKKLRREWKLDDDQIAIGVASRLDPVKGIEYLLAAFARLVEKHPDIVLFVVGTGAVEQELQAKADELGLSSSVRFTGFRSDIEACLSAFDIFALPSLAEYHSIALLEAMRAGRPIVATDVGGNTESVRHEKEALVVQAADVGGLESALDRLITQSELRARLGAAARDRFLSEFTEDVMLAKTADWLNACLVKQAQTG